jgi:hypothetical protein
MRNKWVWFVSFFLLTAIARAQTDTVDLVIGNLQSKPNDTACLALVKSTIPAVSNATDKCRLGVVYVLGCLSSGNTAEGMTVRSQLLKAFPTNEFCTELSDTKIMEPCKACVAGLVQSPCPTCSGRGTCAKCEGTGQQSAVGFDGPRTIRCMYCGGNGKCKKCQGSKMLSLPCSTCAGKGVVLSPAMITAGYLRMLGSGAQKVP